MLGLTRVLLFPGVNLFGVPQSCAADGVYGQWEVHGGADVAGAVARHGVGFDTEDLRNLLTSDEAVGAGGSDVTGGSAPAKPLLIPLPNRFRGEQWSVLMGGVGCERHVVKARDEGAQRSVCHAEHGGSFLKCDEFFAGRGVRGGHSLIGDVVLVPGEDGVLVVLVDAVLLLDRLGEVGALCAIAQCSGCQPKELGNFLSTDEFHRGAFLFMRKPVLPKESFVRTKTVEERALQAYRSGCLAFELGSRESVDPMQCRSAPVLTVDLTDGGLAKAFVFDEGECFGVFGNVDELVRHAFTYRVANEHLAASAAGGAVDLQRRCHLLLLASGSEGSLDIPRLKWRSVTPARGVFSDRRSRMNSSCARVGLVFYPKQFIAPNCQRRCVMEGKRQ